MHFPELLCLLIILYHVQRPGRTYGPTAAPSNFDLDIRRAYGFQNLVGTSVYGGNNLPPTPG